MREKYVKKEEDIEVLADQMGMSVKEYKKTLEIIAGKFKAGGVKDKFFEVTADGTVIREVAVKPPRGKSKGRSLSPL